MSTIGTPTGSGMMDAVKYGALGAGGALVFQLISGFFGNSMIGGLAGIAIAGSVIKGEAGKTLATVIGYDMIRSGAFSLGSVGMGGKNADEQASVI